MRDETRSCANGERKEGDIGVCSDFSCQCQRFLAYCHFGVSRVTREAVCVYRAGKFMENGLRHDAIALTLS